MLTFPPDSSFLIQIVSFLVLWFGLKRLLFDPVLHLLEERDARTTGARQEAADMTAATEISAADYERRMRETRVALATETDAARGAAQSDERRVLAAAREQASTELTRLREDLSRQAEVARPAVASESQTVAELMLQRVFGRPVS